LDWNKGNACPVLESDLGRHVEDECAQLYAGAGGDRYFWIGVDLEMEGHWLGVEKEIQLKAMAIEGAEVA
jgi:hypothetical protein